MHDERSERQKRQEAVYQLKLQADKLFLTIEKPLAYHRFLVEDRTRGRTCTALVLDTSWKFYEYRLSQSRLKFDLLIVQHHNAVVPVPVISLQTGKEYLPGADPEIARPHARRPNSEEVQLFVSKLLLGAKGSEEELQRMPARTRQRYIQRRDQYLKPRIGRPWAS